MKAAIVAGAPEDSELEIDNVVAFVASLTSPQYKEIGDRLSISALTVRSHLHRIYDKLHVRSRTEAVVKFLKRGA